jgi:hypothetical protein
VPVNPRGGAATAPVVLSAVPDHRRSLADGVLVEASVLARVLGMRLLTLHATVVLAPAQVTAPPAGPVRTSAPTLGRLPPGAAGRDLAEAVRTLNEGAEILARARRTGA